MERKAVDLQVGGQKYRVVSSASEAELQRLAVLVTRRLGEVAGKGQASQALVLAAISFAHEAELERAKRMALERRTRDLLARALGRLDRALVPAEEPERGADGR